MKKFLFLALMTAVMALPDPASAGVFRNRCCGQRAGFFQRERHVIIQRGSARGCASCQAEGVPAQSGSLAQAVNSAGPGADVLACVNAPSLHQEVSRVLPGVHERRSAGKG